MKNTVKNLVHPSGNKSTRLAAAIILLFTAVSCITVNVYFPEGAVQRAADDFVKDLYKSTPKPEEKPTSLYAPRFLDEMFISNANAADEIKISSPDALGIKSRMGERVTELSALKGKGVLGETNTGTIVIKEAGSLSLKDRATIERLVAAENQDRSALYDVVQKENQLNDRNQTKIRAHFSKAFQEHSPSGTWIQGESGTWNRK